MPSPDEILAGLAGIANQWRSLAIAWHAGFAALVVALIAGWRPSTRLAGFLLTTPLLSVSALAWASGNPFNAVAFALLALVLITVAWRLSGDPIHVASPPLVAAGAAALAFGWTYPHFLDTGSSIAYAYAAPLGLIPCPTLSAVIGLSLILGAFRSSAWSAALTIAGLLYGAIGVFRLGVTLDYGLLAAVAVLGVSAVLGLDSWRSVRADRDERIRRLPGDELIPSPLGTLTHAVTIKCAPPDVWPWLVQMGAGRAGWYSYDFLDNGRVPSARRIVPELQAIAPGTIFPALPGETGGFTLLTFEPGRFVVVGWIAPDQSLLMTWAFVLEPAGGDSTRLIARARGGGQYQFHGLPWSVAQYLVRIVHFIMQRRQLLGIAQRAEHRP